MYRFSKPASRHGQLLLHKGDAVVHRVKIQLSQNKDATSAISWVETTDTVWTPGCAQEKSKGSYKQHWRRGRRRLPRGSQLLFQILARLNCTHTPETRKRLHPKWGQVCL